MLDPVDDLWPFIVVEKYHPIYRVYPHPPDSGGAIRYFIGWEGFEVILAQMTHRVTAGTAFTPWDRQYVDIKPMDTTDDEDKGVRSTEKPGTGKDRVRTPTEKQVMKSFFEETFVDGAPPLQHVELEENNCKTTGLVYIQDDQETKDEIPPSIQVGDSHEGSVVEGPTASGVEPNQSINHEFDDEKLTDGVEKCLIMRLTQSCRKCSSTNVSARACGDCQSQDLRWEIHKE
ncbi:MAG: hypothetical protein Q9204_001886 [Flavoplaca sp. TL-2023a]